MMQTVILLAFILILSCSALNSPKLLRGRLRQQVYGGIEEFSDFGIVETNENEPKDADSPNTIEPTNNSWKKIVVASVSTFLGISLGYYQKTVSPVSGLALLHLMEKESMPIQQIACTSKPTILEFYADWCEICKKTAPSVRALEYKYADKVNFITLNAIKPQNGNAYYAISFFRYVNDVCCLFMK
jgi:thiol-disulfide isomerase/thioredoxin